MDWFLSTRIPLHLDKWKLTISNMQQEVYNRAMACIQLITTVELGQGQTTKIEIREGDSIEASHGFQRCLHTLTISLPNQSKCFRKDPEICWRWLCQLWRQYQGNFAQSTACPLVLSKHWMLICKPTLKLPSKRWGFSIVGANDPLQVNTRTVRRNCLKLICRLRGSSSI